MSLIEISLILVLVIFLLGLVNRYIPMASSIKILLNGVALIFILYWLLSSFGLMGVTSDIINWFRHFLNTETIPALTQPMKS